MNEFKTYHPVINLVYFSCVIAFSVFFMHPLCLMISLFSSLTYFAVLKGRHALQKSILCMIPVILVATVINAAFNHEGATVLTYLPGGNPLTLESMLYGFFASLMLVSVITWFSCCNEVMTSDKFIYLFGKFIPTLSLVLSMTLRFVPRFSLQLKSVMNARKCMGLSLTDGKMTDRIKNGLSALSATVTWALENSVETADSMKARGYGLLRRSTFSIYIFDKRDKLTLLLILSFASGVIAGRLFGCIKFSYFPIFDINENGLLSIVAYLIYLVLCLMPVIIEFEEMRKWKKLK